MTQKLIFQLLKELGGQGTARQILDLAVEKNMDHTLTNPKLIGTKLSNLCKWQYIQFIGKSKSKGKGRMYKIVDEYPQ